MLIKNSDTSESMNSTNKIEIASLTDECYKRIKQDILLGKLKWGQRLNVINLAQIYGISRSPVIKAIDRLSMERLVCIIPNIGSFVLIPTKEDVRELTEIRLMLETTTCRLCYGKNKNRLLDELRQTDIMINGKSENDQEIRFDLFLEYDRTFHMLFAVFADNERLRVYYESIRNQADLFRTRTYCKRYANLALERHRGIVSALSHDRLEEAVSLLDLHIREVESEILESLESIGVPKEYK